MDLTFLTGIIGSLFAVAGAAVPENEPPKHPTQSLKNWLFLIGALLMTLYAILGYLDGGPIFFILLEALVITACLLSMTTLEDKLKTYVIIFVGAGLFIYALYLFDNQRVIYLILGLITLCLGYAFKNGTLRKLVALVVGSVFISWYSYLEASWVFFWLNVVFGLISGFYLINMLKEEK